MKEQTQARTGRSRNARIRALVLVAIFTLAAIPVLAQSYRGSIHGTVQDRSGAIVAGAKVTLKNSDTGLERETSSAEDGVYSFQELPAGTYSVSATVTGFATKTYSAVVEVSADTMLNFTLSPPTVEQSTTVSATVTPLVEMEVDVLGGSVNEHLVGELPLNGRDFGKLVALVPGVVVEGSGVAGTEKGFGQFNINGNRDRSNNYTLDGTDNNDPWFNNSALNQVGITGAPATLLPIDAIQEFNLLSQFPAEYGRNSGGVVNVITKSGSDQLHGTAFEYFRNSFFDARNYFNAVGDPQTQFINNQFGGSIGGPVIHDKTFFFAAYEGQRERVGSDFNFSLPTETEIKDARALALSINPRIVTAPLDAILSYFPVNNTNSNQVAGVVDDRNNLDNFILKADHRLTANEALAVRYAFGQSDQQFPLGSLGGFGSGSRLPGFAQISPTRVQVVSASLLSTLGPAKINELRFGYTRFRNSFTSEDAQNPVAGVPDFGTDHTGLPEIDFGGYIENLGATAYSIPRARVSQNYQILDNFTWIHGAHTLKFGGEYRRASVSAYNDNLERGLIGFSPTGIATDPVTDVLANFYLGNFCDSSGNCDGYGEANAGNTQRRTYNNGLAFFGQDQFRVRPNLTITYGVRWEYFGPISEKNNLLSNFPGAFGPNSLLENAGSGGLSSAYKRDLNNFGPRISVAWSPFTNTTVRTGYGIYYDYIPQDLMIANYTTSAGIATNPVGPVPVLPLDFNQAAWNGTAPGPVFTAGSGPYSVFATSHNLATPYVGEWNLNIQQQVVRGAAIEIGYVGSKGTRLTRLYDANQDAINPNYGEVDIFATNSGSTYNALQVQARFSNWHGFNGFSSYVFSKSLDGASDGIDFNSSTAAFPQNSDDLQAEKGPSTFDARHRWTSALNYRVPASTKLPERLAMGWELNSVVTVMSGQPIGILTGNPVVNADGSYNYHQRPDLVPGVNPILSGSPANGYLNPLAFAYPTGNFGDLGRDAIYGPGFWNIDFSLTKNTQITERLGLQLRAEFFNIFNHPQFALPGGTIVPGAAPHDPNGCPGCFSTSTPDVAQGNPGLGGGGPRVVQLAARFQF
ncbi:MAG: carboxypeptidase regulatory-like domain-containing protein [Candidatus Acidiferrales bacterium]